jgi:hypothetical protein
VIIDDRRERVLGRRPEDGDRAREHHNWIGSELAARRQERFSRPEVRPHAEVEVRFAFSADRRSQMEDHVGPGKRFPARTRRAGQVSEIASDHASACPRPVGWRQPQKRHPVSAAWLGACNAQGTRRQQLPGQQRAEEARATRDEHVHPGSAMAGHVIPCR